MTENRKDSGPISFDATSDESRSEYDRQLHLALQRLEILPETATDLDRAKIKLDIAEARTGLGETAQAWDIARQAFDSYIEAEQWQEAIEATEVLYQTNEPANIVALAHGVWLSITYPVKPQTTVTMLNYVVDETPDNSDGAAVAAATAHYIAGVRTPDDDFENLSFMTRNLIGKVAERHSNVTSQDELDKWMTKLEINDPKSFLPRMGRVLDIIVIDQWWIDRDALRRKLPVN